MFSNRPPIVASVLGAGAIAAPAASAAPTVTNATGANAAAIQAAVDGYRNSLGANNGGNPAQPSVRNPDNARARSLLPWRPRFDIEAGLDNLKTFFKTADQLSPR